MSEVDSLRQQLRDRGYLTHGIERWFALDPWSSRAFWLELVTVALKAATLIAIFGALPMTAVMLLRNAPLGALETFALFLTYAASWFVASAALLIAIALALKIRPELAIDTPRALLGISIAAGTVLLAPLAYWWYRFDTAPPLPELAAGTALAVLFFLASTVVVSAAMLSFSIYELHRIPAIHQKSRVVPIGVTALALVALLFVPAFTRPPAELPRPMVVTAPSSRRVALVAVDGLTHELLLSRPDLLRQFSSIVPVTSLQGDSTAERWASLGTGVPTEIHGVRSIEGVRFAGGDHALQRVSRADFVLMGLAPFLRVARREPLPPTVRRRDYVWELFAGRGVPSVAVNWWASTTSSEAGLTSVATDEIFAASGGDPLRLDELATRRLFSATDAANPRFATVYLPALDVILNRATLDPSARLARSIRALDGISNAVARLGANGYEVILAGMPGEGQNGGAVVASPSGLSPASAFDLAPTTLNMLGFPASQEMPGKSLIASGPDRIASYGARQSAETSASMNEGYYENLRSLGYIQ